MSFVDRLNDFANQMASGKTSDADVHATYDQVAHQVPQGTLADGITHVFNSPQTPPFEEIVSKLFRQSTPEQKAAMLNQIVGALGPSAAAMLQQVGVSGAAAGGGAVSPQQAQQVSPQQVQVLAQQASKKDPTIVDQAAGFYAQHPTLVKAIGAGALALLMSRMSRR